MDFFDINVYAGSSGTGTYRPARSKTELCAELDRLGITKALLWHIAQCEVSAPDGNRLVSEMVSENPNIYGTWAVLPPQTEEQEKPEIFFSRMKNCGIHALRIFPQPHRFLLNRTVFGEFLDAVAERKIPVLFSISRNDVTWDGLYQILTDYPKLVCVICDTGIWGTDRSFRPLVEKYENVYVETSLMSLGEGVMEAFVRDYGPHRLLFGSGFPERIPEAAMLQLLHADIKDEEKEAIACTNSERIIAEAEL